jgi:hypothetical protein
VSGEDAADKIRILAWLTFGIAPAVLAVRTRGIALHADRLAADAAAVGGVPRLLTECARVSGGIAAAIEPAIVRADSPLGQVRGENNLVMVQSRWNGTLHLAGPGAGGGPTACALLGDLIRSARPLRLPRLVKPGHEPEETRHRSLVSVEAGPGAERSVASTLNHLGFESRSLVPGATMPRVLVENAPWSAMEAAAHALDKAGLNPVISRLEM